MKPGTLLFAIGLLLVFCSCKKNQGCSFSWQATINGQQKSGGATVQVIGVNNVGLEFFIDSTSVVYLSTCNYDSNTNVSITGYLQAGTYHLPLNFATSSCGASYQNAPGFVTNPYSTSNGGSGEINVTQAKVVLDQNPFTPFFVQNLEGTFNFVAYNDSSSDSVVVTKGTFSVAECYAPG